MFFTNCGEASGPIFFREPSMDVRVFILRGQEMPKKGYNTTLAFRLTTHSYNNSYKLAMPNLEPRMAKRRGKEPTNHVTANTKYNQSTTEPRSFPDQRTTAHAPRRIRESEW
jgi:hypothetical protein